MESLFGLVGDGYVLMAADTAAVRSVVKFKDTEDKIYEVDQSKLIGVTGSVGDRVNFTEYILRNIHLYELRNGVPMSTHATAHWTRRHLADSLRRDPYEVAVLVGGHDETKGPSLYFIDYLGSLQQVDKAAQGHCQYFILSVLDKYWKKNMTLEEGLDVMGKCVKEIQTRFVINTPHFVIKVADKDGVREVKLPGAPERPLPIQHHSVAVADAAAAPAAAADVVIA